VTQTKVPVEEEISNRRVCLDFTFFGSQVSQHVPGSDQGCRGPKRSFTRPFGKRWTIWSRPFRPGVRVDGELTRIVPPGNALWACFVHRTTRPVSGKVDPHWHCHALLMNATYDAVENRWKAAQLGEVISSKGFFTRPRFNSRWQRS